MAGVANGLVSAMGRKQTLSHATASGLSHPFACSTRARVLTALCAIEEAPTTDRLLTKSILILSAGLALAIFASASATARTGAPAVPRFQSPSCGFKDEAEDWPAKNGVSCGWVTVKAHHERSDSATLRLWVVKVAANGAASADGTPLIRLWYGPMAANITPAALKGAQFTDLVRATRDVIFFDYRGMGRSEPEMKCTVAPATGATVDSRLRAFLRSTGNAGVRSKPRDGSQRVERSCSVPRRPRHRRGDGIPQL